MRSSRGVVVARYVLLTVLAALFLLPFYVLLRNAFSTPQQMAAAQWQWIPDNHSLDNLRALFANDSVRMGRSVVNSAVVAVVRTVATVAVSAMAGYGLARIENRLSKIILGMTLLTLMVPAAVTFIPSFVMVSSLGWISTLRGLIIPVLFSAFATFLFRQYFLGFPKELEEAAFIDGAGYWRTFWRIVMPNTFGICAAIGAITFIGPGTPSCGRC
ncbi:MAG: ABC transporter, permease protein 2 (cluster 1, maltose/g3p/polyamine/iron) [uncultured Propionibacteriaceae bacterium]|uniref:ABC transporter, permease protein 2 (Cluster 1, maltose/g3p/polyamine/iron) n=1 Tax=uncultured Propionibacteriaceae bacterium TaxID=257457 RepID=A0A6J4NXN0_9ACTN|nr:MAG: ABC transporter, permease protein 2 (cluster 1, maltose/g3p/polyamine/iron) [uncultured Propionibacteriaceae bacterium]